VRSIEKVPGRELPLPARRNLLSALRVCAERLTQCNDLAKLLDGALTCLRDLFDIHHAMVLMLDGSGQRLYTVASRGYEQSGVGSEIAIGCGVIGVAAEQRTPIRIMHMTADYSYGRAIRESVEREGLGGRLETAIPLPGLPDSRSQMAAPILAGGRFLGILYVESPEDKRFWYDDEDALVAVAAQLGMAINTLAQFSESPDETPPAAGQAMPAAGAPVVVRHYAADDSVFIDDDYLIKGVAGAIFCKLLRDYTDGQRTEFTNRELRLDPSIGLPDLSDNLEARLILLERRLSERSAFLRIDKTGRGRFRLNVGRPFRLVDVG
jgi:adenylate cyclase